ncbi:hypothetical protein GRI97_09970 [Altererythrobacter xixiisoli]|uniref:Uncharacterized protein n=1 Tax=Croceibacterium xixiisoli TaxID=1476466 RepID=A0A6I4TT31_9SPHN|nr:hypothetical protein [Croceibacterium xixiisoli]MXO99315.1 hypothetical protein [Croceibacterium xixiisoli]
MRPITGNLAGSLALIAATGGVQAATAPALDAPAFAIPNPQRPGAKAADCTTLTETEDGCTFHTAKDGVNQVQLPGGEGVEWVVRASDPQLLEIHRLADAAAADGAPQQIFTLVPTTAHDADVVVTFDRLESAAGVRQLVERRRASVMVHATQE